MSKLAHGHRASLRRYANFTTWLTIAVLVVGGVMAALSPWGVLILAELLIGLLAFIALTLPAVFVTGLIRSLLRLDRVLSSFVALSVGIGWTLLVSFLLDVSGIVSDVPVLMIAVTGVVVGFVIVRTQACRSVEECRLRAAP